MSRILALVALVLSCACFGSAQVETSRERLGLRGPVRRIQVEMAKVSSAGHEGEKVVLYINEYDRNGNTVHQTMNSPDGSRRWKYGWRHIYDARGRDIRIDYFNANGVLTSSGITIYDDNARTAQLSQHNPNGSINHIREISFDKKGNKISEIFRYPCGIVSAQSSTYNSQGKPTEVIFRDIAGNLDHRVLWNYDDHGSPTELIIEQPDGKRRQHFKKDLTYDENGNVVEELNYRPDGSPKTKETFTYEFDAPGNWTKRTTVREVLSRRGASRESEITYRLITYF
jgi:antitoxin component YwqK of YwqJK toxin-antitoxin module